MKVHLYAANTGQGHISVLNALSEQLMLRGVEVNAFPSFYEDVSDYNAFTSRFYNIIQQRSSLLCAELSDVMVLEGRKQKEKSYPLYENYLKNTLQDYPDAIISVTPLINYAIVRFISEQKLNIRFYIVVTDPYKPMYPGFEEIGADCYFCPNEIVRTQLLERGITYSKTKVTGYPIHSKFAEYEFESKIKKMKARFMDCIPLNGQ